MAQLSIKQREAGDITILDLSGKITIGEGSVQLREAVRNLLDSGRKKILLNLGDVSYVDSSGIGELVSSYSTALPPTSSRQGASAKRRWRFRRA